MNNAIWINKRRRVTGYWRYAWSANKFIITLDSRDRITGLPRTFEVCGDTPEWGNWKLIQSVESA